MVMDWTTPILGIEAMYWLIVALGIFVGAWMFPKILGLAGEQRKQIMAVGLIGSLLVVGVASGMSFGATDDSTGTASVLPQVEYDIYHTSPAIQTWVSPNDAGYLVSMSFNDTSDAFVGSTQYCEINFTAELLAGYGSQSLTFEIRDGDVGITPISTTIGEEGGADPILAIGTDDEYQADFTNTDGDVKIMKISMPLYVEDNIDSVVLNLTASNLAVAYMDLHDTATTKITISDSNTNVVLETVAVLWSKDTITT